MALEFSQFAFRIFSILVTLTGCGAWLVWWLVPRRQKWLWPILAPIAGSALLANLLTMGAWSGIAVGKSAVAIAFFFSLVSASWAWRMMRTSAGRIVLVHYFRRHGHSGLLVSLAVVAISAMMIMRLPGTHLRDAWHSSDYFAYWSVAEYLQENGAKISAYRQQTEFSNPDIEDHLSRHARLGSMSWLAALASMTASGDVQAIINPSIVALQILLIGLVWILLKKGPSRQGLFAVLAACHPFTYFLLHFSYLSQALGVVLFLAGLIVHEWADDRSGSWRAIALSATLVAAAAISYPTILICLPIYWLYQAIIALRRRSSLTATTMHAVVTLTLAAYYLPQVVHELTWAWRLEVLPGWDWQGLIGALEFTGIRSVLGYHYPFARGVTILWLDWLASIAIAVAAFLIFRDKRYRSAIPFLVLISVALIISTLMKVRQGVPHATHGYVKAVSLFTPVLWPIFASVIWQGVASHFTATRNAALALFICSASLLQLRAIYLSEQRAAEAPRELILLARDVLEKNAPIRFEPRLIKSAEATIARNRGRIAAQEDNDAVVILLKTVTPNPDYTTIASTDRYVATKRTK